MGNISKDKLLRAANALFVVFAIDYILLFGAETALPGFVTKVFNLNLLLLGALAMWLFAYFLKTQLGTNDISGHCQYFKYIDLGLLVFLLLVLVISLYKLAPILILLYALFGALSFWMLRKYLIAEK